MVRLREGFDPVEQLFQVGGSTFGQQCRLDLQCVSERQQPPGCASPGRHHLAWHDLGPIAFDHGAPAVSFLMPNPINFLGIKRRQATGDSLASQIILFRMVLHVGTDGVIPAFDTKFVSAGLVNQFSRVPKANGEELHEARRIRPLPGIVPLLFAPLDKAGPAG